MLEVVSLDLDDDDVVVQRNYSSGLDASETCMFMIASQR